MEADDIIVRLVGIEHTAEELGRRVGKCEEMQDTLHALALSTEKIALNVERMSDEQVKQGERLRQLEQTPVDEWKDYKKTIINCVTTGILGVIIGSLLALIIR